MADVKVPPLLHKMSLASQKAWYKKHGMEMPSAPAAGGKSAAQAKKDVGEINKQKAKEKSALQKALENSPKQKELKKSSERVRQMAANALAFGGQRPGGDLTTARGMVNYIRSGGYLKAGRLGEESESLEERSQENKEKLKNYVRTLGTRAKIKGLVPFDQWHSPLRAGRKVLQTTPTNKMNTFLKKEEVEQIDEVTKKEAEQTLGGPVKEKPTMPPGKQPAGYRYVRGLARKAMKAGLKKEEVELVEETIDETYQSKYSGYPLARTKYVTKAELKAREKDKKLRTTSDYKDHVARLKKVKHLKKMVDDIHNNMQMDFWSSKSGNKSNPIDDATHKRLLNRINSLKEEIELAEASKDTADVGEYDYEGDMAKSQLRSILANAKRLHDMLEDQTNLPEWVQSKITLAEDYILTAANYMEGEMNEEVEQIDEVKAVKAYDKKGKLVGRYRSMDHAKQMKPSHTYKVEEEVEQIDEAKTFNDIKQQYNRNENENRHTENTLLLAKHFGTEEEKSLAQKHMDALNKHGHQPHYVENSKLHTKLLGRAKGMKEEVVTEAEGKVAVTPKEKDLAAHHGDKTKITYGDVIKARLKSAAAKKMGKQ